MSSFNLRHRRGAQSQRKVRPFRPWLELLEDRLAPATYTWTGNGANDLWSNAANWDIGVPVDTADVVIADVAGSNEVLFDSSVPGSGVILNSLTCSEPFHLSGDTLTLDGAGSFQFNARFTFDGGALGGTGTLIISGPTTWSAGAMTGSGTTRTDGGLTISGGAVKDLVNQRTLQTAGATNMTGGRIRTGGAGTGVVIANTGIWDINVDDVGGSGLISRDFGGTTGTFDNQGIVRKSAGTGVATLGLGFVNSGAIETLTGTNELSLGLKGSATSTGNFAPTAGTTIRLQGGGSPFGAGAHILNATSTASGPGTIAFDGGTTNIIGNFNPGITSIIGGTVNFNADVNATALSLSSGTLGGTGIVTFSAASTWTGGTMTGTGTTKTDGGLTISNATVKDLVAQRTLRTAGTTTVIGGRIRTGGVGTGVVIANTGTWDVKVDDAGSSVIGRDFGGTTGTFDNQGIVRKSAGTGIATLGLGFVNSGTIETLTGTNELSLGLKGSTTSTGNFAPAAGTTIRAQGGGGAFGAGAHTLNATSTASGPGTVAFDAATTNIIGNFNPGITSIIGGTVNFNADVNASALSLSSGTLGGTGIVTFNAASTWTGGTMTGTGTTRTDGGLTISNATVKDLVAQRTLQTAGTTTVSGGRIRTGGIGSGVAISNTGTWDIKVDDAGSSVIGRDFGGAIGAFDNQGIVLKSAGTGVSTLGLAFTNGGTLDIQTGTIRLDAGLTNFAANTLTGGAYLIKGTLQFNNANIVTNAANIVLDGPTSAIVNQSNVNGLAAFNKNDMSLTLKSGRVLNTPAFTNAGLVTIETGCTIATAAPGFNNTGTLAGGGTVIGNVSNSGHVNPGTSPGVLTITGDYTQGPGGTLNIELGGLNVGTQFDRLSVSGIANLAGTLHVAPIAPYLPDVGDGFRVLEFGSRNGDFTVYDGLDLGSNRRLAPVYDAAGLVLGVDASNSAPVLDPIGTKTVDELQQLNFTATAHDTDAPPNTLTFSLDAGAPEGAAIDSVSGEFTWTPSEAQGPGNYFVTVRVTDDGPPHLDDAETIMISVAEVNAAPILTFIPDVEIDERVPFEYTVTAIDPDIPATSLTFSLVDNIPAGASINASTGVFRWTPSESQGFGVHEITVRVADHGTPVRGTQQKFTVTVRDVNIDPIARNDSSLINANVSVLLDVLANDTDGDGDVLTITSAGPASHGSVAIEDGQLRYTPDTGYFGADTFDYTVSDDHGGTDTETVTITVNAVPVAGNDVYAAEKHAVLTVPAPGVLGNDADGDNVIFVAAVNGVSASVGQQVTLPSGALLKLNANGSFTYDPNGQFAALTFGQQATDVFDYTVSDGRGGNAQAGVTIVITNSLIERADLTLTTADIQFSPSNPAPGQTVTMSARIHNTGYTTAGPFTVDFRDFGLSLGIAAVPSLAAGASTLVSIDTSFALDGVRLISVVSDSADVVSETNEANNKATLVLQVGEPQPLLGLINVTANSITAQRGQIVAATGDAYYDFPSVPGPHDFPVQGGAVTIEILHPTTLAVLGTFSGAHTTVNADWSQVIVAPAAIGTYILRATVTDSTAISFDLATLTVVAPAPSDPPPPFVAPTPSDPPPPQATPGGTIQIGGGSSGGLGSGAASSAVHGANENVYVFSEHIFFSNFNPAVGEQIYAFAYINYQGTNDPFSPFTVTLNDIFPVAGALQTVTVGAALVGFPAGQADSPQVVVFSYTNTAAGPHILQIDTSPPPSHNSNPLDDDATRILFVGPPDEVLDVQKTAILLVDADENGMVTPGDTLRYTIIATNGSVVDVPGAFVNDDFDERLTGTPENISNGGTASNGAIHWDLGTFAAGASITLTYDLPVLDVSEDAILSNIAMIGSDGDAGDFDASRVLIHALHPPVARDDDATTDEDTAVNVPVLANDTDADNDTLTVSAWTQGQHGSVSLNNDGTLKYTPDANYNGSDSFSYTISDGQGGIASATVAITVTPVNDAPVANAGADKSSNETESVDFDGAGSSDPDGDAVTYSWDFGDGDTATGPTPSHAYADDGEYTVTLTVSDGAGGTHSDTLKVRVHNLAPNADDDAAATNEDQPVAVNVLDNDSDPAGTHDPLQIVAVSNGTKGTASIDTKGTADPTDDVITYAPNPGETGSDSFTYTISDGDGSTATASVTVQIRNLVDLAGRVYDDLDNDGIYEPDNDEQGIANFIVQLLDDVSGTLIAAQATAADGAYSFDVNLSAGSYRIVAGQPADFLDGRETAGNLGGVVNNTQDSDRIRAINVGNPGATADAIDYLFGRIRPSQAIGMVWNDADNDGVVDFNETAIQGVNIHLTGLDDRGNNVSRSAVTDANGAYAFANLRPSSVAGYTLHEIQPSGFADGLDMLGTVNDLPIGNASVNDTFSAIIMTHPGDLAENFNFGERLATNEGGIVHGQTATIGFWQNKNGQKLINALNGGPTSNALGNWLAATFPNMYGAGANNLAGKTNKQVAEFYKTLFARSACSAAGGGPTKMDAQVMATALAVYVTNQSLAGTTAASFGFLVTATGVGSRTFNVGTNGAAFGVANGSNVTVLDLLTAVNSRSRKGILFDLDCDSDATNCLETTYRTMANIVFTDINEMGDI